MRFSKQTFQLLVVAGLLAAPAASVSGAEIKRLGTYEKWSAHLITEGRAKTCYLHGEPTGMKGDYKSRGRVFVQITHRPAEGTKNEVGFTAGYKFQKESETRVTIDKKRFVLFTDRDTAWTRDARADRALVRAMMKGRTMTVRGKSARGTATADTYSLIGFTQAYRAIGKACRVR